MKQNINPGIPPHKIYSLLEEVGNEAYAARLMHGKFHSRHEGYAVLLEEVDELWDLIREKSPDPSKMRKEAIQVAAMAMRFALECCGEDSE